MAYTTDLLFAYVINYMAKQHLMKKKVIYTLGALCHLFSCKFWVNTSEDKQLVKKWTFCHQQDSIEFCSLTESKQRGLALSLFNINDRADATKGFG